MSDTQEPESAETQQNRVLDDYIEKCVFNGQVQHLKDAAIFRSIKKALDAHRASTELAKTPTCLQPDTLEQQFEAWWSTRFTPADNRTYHPKDHAREAYAAGARVQVPLVSREPGTLTGSCGHPVMLDGYCATCRMKADMYGGSDD